MKLKYFLQICILSFLCIACNSELEDKLEKPVNNIEDYIAFGKLHNDLLEVAGNICASSVSRSDEFSFLEEDSTLFRRIHAAQISAVEQMSISDTEKGYLKASLNESVIYYQTDNVYQAIQPENEPICLDDEICQLCVRGIIDDYEEVILHMLITAINDNREDGDHEALKKQIRLLSKMWQAHYGQKEEKAGELSGHVLGIAYASIDWWEENYEETRAIPFWLGADAAGAIVGAVFNAGTQYLTTKNINLTQVGYHALGSAVISSTGLVKHIAIWIVKAL